MRLDHQNSNQADVSFPVVVSRVGGCEAKPSNNSRPYSKGLLTRHDSRFWGDVEPTRVYSKDDAEEMASSSCCGGEMTATLNALDGAVMSAFVRARKP